MTDKESTKEFRESVVAFFFALIIILGLFFLVTSSWKPLRFGVESPKFEVVDQYKNCDVVRYTDPSNRYRYFLDCFKQ